MRTLSKIMALSLSIACLLLATACVKQPTQSEATVDLRPAISFTPKSETQITSAYTVFVDNLPMGTADQYLTGEAALRVLAGTHVVELRRGDETVLKEKVYLGDGAIKSLLIP